MHRDDQVFSSESSRTARARAFAESRCVQSKIIAIDQLVLTYDDRLAVPQFMLRDALGLDKRSVRAPEIQKYGFSPNRFNHGVSAADTLVVVQHDVAGGMATDRRVAQLQVHVAERLAPEFDNEFAHGLLIFRSCWFNIK
jgi:hypothetical protein